MAAGYGSFFLPPSPDAYCVASDCGAKPLNLQTGLFYFAQWRTQEFCSGGVQQIQLRTEDRENGDLGTVAPKSEVLEAAVI